jgi:hypothetical protein
MRESDEEGRKKRDKRKRKTKGGEGRKAVEEG